MSDLTDETSGGAERPRRRAVLTALLGALVGGAAMVFVIRRIVRDWEVAASAIQDAAPGWILMGFLLASLTVSAQAAGWRTVLRLVGVQLPLRRVLVWYFVGEIGKYLPGGVWPVLGRGELARRGGVPRARSYASVMLSLALLYLAAMLVAVGFLPFAIGGSAGSPWMAALVLLPVGITVLHHRVLEGLVDIVGRMTRWNIQITIPRWSDSLQALLRYAPTWITTGLATWSVARGLEPATSLPRLIFATTLAWIAGVVAVPVPAGAGVREAVFIATCGLTGGVAAAVAIIARLLFAVVDGGGAIVGALLLRGEGGRRS